MPELQEQAPEDFWPARGDTVVIDDAGGAFHGQWGTVMLLERDRRPLPWIRVLPTDFRAWALDPEGEAQDGVLFTAYELVVLDR